MIIVAMGVSGSGKSTLGEALAQALGWDFQEGDALHPQSNVDKMQAGIPLDDSDRAPWLTRIVDWMDEEHRGDRNGVVSCSALKRRYRDHLRQSRAEVRFAYLALPRVELESRLRHRDHFMPASLLDSQLQALEVPGDDEPALTLDGMAPLSQNISRVRDWLHAD
jgi:gluconokinase